MRILLTGATGFIGGHLVSELSSRHEIISVVRPGVEPPPGTEVVEWDLATALRPEILPGKADAIVHFGLPRNFKDFPDAADAVFQVGVRATMDLLQYARISGAEHFILASTGNMVAPYYTLGRGDIPVPPNDIYTASKMAAEALIRPFRSCFSASILRLFFPYGRGQVERTIPNLVNCVRSGKPVVLAGGNVGDELSLVHVDDLASVVQEALSQNWDGLFDVGTPEVITVRQICETIGKKIGIDPIFKSGSEPPKRMVADLTSLNEVYDPSRMRTFAEGLKDIL